jgi:hypothetical protein
MSSTWFAAHGKAHFAGKLANLFIAELPQAASGFNQALLPNHCDVFRTRGRVGLEPCFAGGQEDMRRGFFVNARCERYYQYSVGAVVAIARVERYDHDGPLSFVGRINVQLNEPDLAAKREPVR